jgi:hypothetical protein
MAHKTRKNKKGGASVRSRSSSRNSSASANASANASVRPPSPMGRSVTCSHLIYNDLHENEEKQNILTGLFTEPLIPRMLTSLTSDGSEITFKIDDSPRGVYLNWKQNGKKLITVSIHTGRYARGATSKMLQGCVKKGNAHIFFNKLNVIPKQIKITADDEIFISPVKLTNSREANAIINTIVKILNDYSRIHM